MHWPIVTLVITFTQCLQTEGSLVLSPGLERVEGVLGRQGDCGRQLRLIRLTPDLLSWISAVITQNPHITRVN